jgi:hypothetical protein
MRVVGVGNQARLLVGGVALGDRREPSKAVGAKVVGRLYRQLQNMRDQQALLRTIDAFLAKAS